MGLAGRNGIHRAFSLVEHGEPTDLVKVFS
jgi:hypothetical protein